jgi:hypothetical protein
MNLPQRARKATGLDIEAFAPLVGVPWRRLQQWEQGKGGAIPSALATVLRLLEARPRECVEVLQKVQRQRVALRQRLAGLVLELGRGPKRAVALDELRKAAKFRDGPLGKEPVPFAEDDEVTGALRFLEGTKRVLLEPSMDADTVGVDLAEAAIKDEKRGLLVYACVGPVLEEEEKKRPRRT